MCMGTLPRLHALAATARQRHEARAAEDVAHGAGRRRAQGRMLVPEQPDEFLRPPQRMALAQAHEGPLQVRGCLVGLSAAGAGPVHRLQKR